MPKGAKKRKVGARSVTHDEVAAYSDTSTLFKSNLFKLQTAELLKEVSPSGSATQGRLEAAVRALRDELTALPSTELSWERGGAASHPHLSHLALANDSVKVAFTPPAKVELAGSYLLRTCAAPGLNVDVTLELPASLLLEKDYLDGRYVDKRLMYLTHLAHLLSTSSRGGEGGGSSKGKAKAKAGATSASVVSAATPPLFITLPHMQSRRWPALQIRLCDLSGGEDGTRAEIEGWSVRLLPSLPADAFPPAKLRAPRCNLRSLGTQPSPTHNNLMRLESGGYGGALQLLHATYARDVSGSLREATTLLKVWLRQRVGGQAASATGFQLSLLLLHLIHTRKITLQMSSYHMLRVVLAFLKTTDLHSTPIVLPPMPSAAAKAPPDARKKKKSGRGDADDADDDEEEDDGEEEEDDDETDAAVGGADAAATHEAVSAFRSYFPWVLVDAHATVNYGCGVSLGALKELSNLAASSLATLDTHALSDAASFSRLLTERRPIVSKYDAVLHVRLPPAGAPPPPGAGKLPLPQVTSEDPTDGADALAAAAAAGAGAPALSHARPSIAVVEGLLALGLSERIELCRAWQPHMPPWDPLAPAAKPSGGGGGGTLMVGLMLDSSKTLQVVDRGPSPSQVAEASAWTALWGPRSETRRFKDGAIIHAVVWDLANAERHTSILHACRALLTRHVGVAAESVRASVGACDDALLGPGGTGVSMTSSVSLTKAFDKLSSTIRNLVRARHARLTATRTRLTATRTLLSGCRLDAPAAAAGLLLSCRLAAASRDPPCPLAVESKASAAPYGAMRLVSKSAATHKPRRDITFAACRSIGLLVMRRSQMLCLGWPSCLLLAPRIPARRRVLTLPFLIPRGRKTSRCR